MVGRRNRCARTAAIGKLKTTLSWVERSGTASSSVRSKRTFHEPLSLRARRRFQPFAAGVIKTGVDVGSITKTPSR